MFYAYRVVAWFRLIRFSHSIFSLAPALLSVAWLFQADDTWVELLWLAGALFGARTAALSWNRYVDRDFDKRNPRTASRELPRGRIQASEALIIVGFGLCLLFVSAAFLNLLCLFLSPVLVIVLLGYSLIKRLSWLCHPLLGVSLALAPLGVDLGLHAEISLFSVLFGSALFFWVSGFDIIYACSDINFDRKEGLKSIPADYGFYKSFRIAFCFHVLFFISWFVLCIYSDSFVLWFCFPVFVIQVCYGYFIARSGSCDAIMRSFSIMSMLVSIGMLVGSIFIVFSVQHVYSI